MEVKIYKMDGSESGKMNLPETLFAVEGKSAVVHEALVAQEANSRVRLSKTKDRSEVAGGGKKPWKQKGTGRARHGSSRSPIWVGGGITFGPDAFRNFSIKINKRAKQKALALVLSDKVREDLLIVVDGLEMSEVKTKNVAQMRAKLPGAKETALIVSTPAQAFMKRAVRNLPRTGAMPVNALNVRDLLKYRCLIISKDAIEAVIKQYAK